MTIIIENEIGHGWNTNVGAVYGFREGFWNHKFYFDYLLPESQNYDGVLMRCSLRKKDDMTTERAYAQRNGLSAVNNHIHSLKDRGLSGKGADILISWHSDAAGKNATGTSVYDTNDLKKADKSLAYQLGYAIAKAYATNFKGVFYRQPTSADIYKVEDDPTGTDDYYGVIGWGVESTAKHVMLIERAYHSNVTDCRALMDDTKNKAAARAIMDVLAKRFGFIRKGESKTPIMGNPTTSIDQMQAYAQANKANNLAVDLAPLFYEIAVQKGIDPAVIYAQSMKETNFFKFTGVLDASFKNPCGLKTKSGGGNDDPNAHQRFSTWEQGIIAHADHLALYAGAPGYPKKDTPDPRHDPKIRGVAPTVEQLGGPGRWAPSLTYGTDIVERMKDLTSTPKKEIEPVETPIPQPTEKTELDTAQKWAIDAGIMRDRNWDAPLTKKEVAWVLMDLIRRVVKK